MTNKELQFLYSTTIFDFQERLLAEILEARRHMLRRQEEIRIENLRSGVVSFYDSELEGYRAQIFHLIDTEIARQESAND